MFTIITVFHKKVRGRLRQFHQLRLCPLETERFRWGLPIGRPSLRKDVIERFKRDVDAYLADALEAELENRTRKKRPRPSKAGPPGKLTPAQADAFVRFVVKERRAR